MLLEDLKGSIPAVVTTLNRDGSLDEAAYKNLIRNIISEGCNGVMVLGSCGEGALVNKKTYVRALEVAKKEVDNKGVVIASTGAGSTENVLGNIHIAEKIEVDAVLNIPPFYNVMPQKAIKDFFLKLAETSKLPLMIYNIPQITKNQVELDTLCELSKHENIVGVKDSSGDHICFQQIVKHTKENDFKVFIGRAPLVMASLLAGASGSMCPIPNLNPRLVLDIHKFLNSNELEKASELQIKICEITKLFSHNSYAINTNLKGIMSGLGMCQPYTAGFSPVLTSSEAEMLKERYIKILGGM